ncbi:MAG: zinc ribbon domain-containing protein [Prolixibacteraceae bacterium]|jgi:hypothetical protein
MEKIKCTTCETENPANYKYCSSCGYELPKNKTENADNAVAVKPVKKSGKGKTILIVLVYAVSFGLSYFVVQQLFFKAPAIDNVMMKVASEINKNCPVMVDAETRLDNAISLPKNIFQYNYTLLTLEKDKIDTTAIKTYLEPTITNTIKSSPDMKYMRDHKIIINYYYKDKEGNYLFSISVPPSKYE